MNEWLFEIIRNKIKASTFDRYEDVFRNYIKPAPFAYHSIKDIKTLDIQKYYNELFKLGKSSSRIQVVNKLLKQFMNYAVNEGYILRNPCIKSTIPGKNEQINKEVEVFNRDELKTILNSDDSSLIKSIAIVSLSTGMRMGEVIGLKWDDIDHIHNEINIKRIVSCYTDIDGDIRRKVRVLQSPKTKSSTRTIPFPKSLQPILDYVKKEQSLNRLKSGESYNKEYTDLIFLTEDGNLFFSTNITRSWKLFLKRLNIPYRKFHALRHTYATLQFEANIPLKTVSVLLGHSKIDITANTYTHVLKKEKEKSADIINVLNMC